MMIDQIRDVSHIEQKVFDAINASHLPVALFGAGGMLRHVLPYVRQHGIEPMCICDNDPAKQGTVYLGLPVCRYDELKYRISTTGGKCHIIISVGPKHKEAVFVQLAKEHERNSVWYLQGYELYGEKLDYPYVCAHAAEFETVYEALADDFSRKVFVQVLNAKISGDMSLYKQIASGTQYFDKDVIKLNDWEIFLDVGAYRGDAILEFVRRTDGHYGGIIAFEPDKETFSILEQVVKSRGISKAELYNIAVWSCRKMQSFHGGGEGSSTMSVAANSTEEADTITVDTIDHLLHGRRVTYLAMDIEGAERMAILGAEKTIRKWKPQLAISVYHRREDIFDLLLLIKSFVPDYKFFLRHYMYDQTETILYAGYGI